MSVHGEFQRILAELVAFLERTGTPGGVEWIRVLRAGAILGRKNVTEGARDTLALLEGDSAPTFESPLEIEEFARLQDHLASICRVVLGR